MIAPRVVKEENGCGRLGQDGGGLGGGGRGEGGIMGGDWQLVEGRLRLSVVVPHRRPNAHRGELKPDLSFRLVSPAHLHSQWGSAALTVATRVSRRACFLCRRRRVTTPTHPLTHRHHQPHIHKALSIVIAEQRRSVSLHFRHSHRSL